MDVFLQQIINGLVIGSVYALVALGLTLMFGILEIPNFSHGQVYMVGAFVVFYLTTLFTFNFYLATLAAMFFTAVLGVVVEKVFFKKIRGQGLDAALICALAVAILLRTCP